jgi:hypothetical protein
MSLPVEIWLALGIGLFYLYDSLVMLGPNELVLIESGGRWKFFVPLSDWQVGGKYVYLPNPFVPVQTLYRLDWQAGGPGQVDAAALNDFLGGQRFLRPVVLVLFCLLAFLLPVAICRAAPLRLLLAIVGEVYVFIVIAALLLYRQHAALRLDRKAALKLAMDGLLCAPFSINLIRKLGLGYNWQGDPVAFARGALKPERFAALRESLLRRIDKDLQMLDEEEPLHKTLRQARCRFSEMDA